MNHEAVYRTAPATPGLLKTVSQFVDASGKNLGDTIRIGREIRCLPYTGFFKIAVKSMCFVNTILNKLYLASKPPLGAVRL